MFEPPHVRFELDEPYINVGTGNIAVEAPAILKLAAKYYVGVNNDIRLGRRRAGCNTCNVTARKDGDAGGTTARILTLVGGPKTFTLPPTDAAGRLTVQPDYAQWVSTSFTDADEVDFIVSVHQDKDEQGGSAGYDEIDKFVRYSLSRVDWAAVDRMLEHQRMNVVGVGINGAGNTYYWFEDEHKNTLSGLPTSHDVVPDPELPSGPAANLPEAAAPGGQAPPPPGTYSVPSTRIGSDVVVIDISANDRVFAWYDDGHVSVGNSGNLSTYPSEYVEYSVPPGYSYNDVVGVAMTSGNTVVSWFRTGKVSSGDFDDFGTTLYDFSLPPGQAIGEIVDMAIHKVNDDTFTVFKDGSVAEGDYDDLDRFGYRPGEVVGMAMQNGKTTIWYKSGYRRELQGSPADNRVNAAVLSTSGYYRLPLERTYHEIAGVARPLHLSPTIWFTDGARSTAGSSGDFLTAGPAGSTTWPLGMDGNLAVSFASHDGVTNSWYNTGHRAKGSPASLASSGQWPDYDLPAGQHEFTIATISIDTGPQGDGDVWTLFRDGAVARGRSYDLADIQYWPSPHPILLP